MKKNVTDLEILDFAEGLPLDRETEHMLVAMLSGSPEFRRDLEEYRRDLARIDAQIPNFPLTLELAQQLPNLAQAIFRRRVQKDFAPAKFFKSQEIVLVVVFVVAMMAMMTAYVLMWKRN